MDAETGVPDAPAFGALGWEAAYQEIVERGGRVSGDPHRARFWRDGAGRHARLPHLSRPLRHDADLAMSQSLVSSPFIRC